MLMEGLKIHQVARQDSCFQYEEDDHTKKKNDEEYEKSCTSSTYTSSIGEESMDDDNDSGSNSNGSSSQSSSDTTDDASSSSPSSSFSSPSSMYDLSAIMAHLPIKRGLSRFYDGKSESFTSLSRVTSTEDLAKKTTHPFRRNHHHLKASKSCGTGLNSSYKAYTLPKPVISKKATTRVSSFSSFPTKRRSFVVSTKPPMVSSTQEFGMLKTN